MGIFSAPQPTQLVPADPPIAVFRNFIAQRPTTLVLKEKVWSLSGDSFSVKDAATGQPVVLVAGKAMSLRDRKRESPTLCVFHPSLPLFLKTNEQRSRTSPGAPSTDCGAR